jgi:hypothetical protein
MAPGTARLLPVRGKTVAVARPAVAEVPFEAGFVQTPWTTAETLAGPLSPTPVAVRLLAPQFATVTAKTKTPFASTVAVPTDTPLSVTVTVVFGVNPPAVGVTDSPCTAVPALTDGGTVGCAAYPAATAGGADSDHQTDAKGAHNTTTDHDRSPVRLRSSSCTQRYRSLGALSLASERHRRAAAGCTLVDVATVGLLANAVCDVLTDEQLASAIGVQFAALVDALERPPSGGPSAIKVTVVEDARLPISPVSPRSALNLGLCAADRTRDRCRGRRTPREPGHHRPRPASTCETRPARRCSE